MIAGNRTPAELPDAATQKTLPMLYQIKAFALNRTKYVHKTYPKYSKDKKQLQVNEDIQLIRRGQNIADSHTIWIADKSIWWHFLFLIMGAPNEKKMGGKQSLSVAVPYR